jgi:hypothetical protein
VVCPVYDHLKTSDVVVIPAGIAPVDEAIGKAEEEPGRALGRAIPVADPVADQEGLADLRRNTPTRNIPFLRCTIPDIPS